MKPAILAALLVLSLSLQASAAEKSKEIFDHIDADKNQELSLDELLKSDVRIDRGDKGAFVISPAEKGKGSNLAASDKQKRALFERLDTDKSGTISRREWMDSVSTGIVLFRF